MKQFRFLDWKIYLSAQSLFQEVLAVTRKLPKEYRFDVGSQLIRSSFSVVLNIAEGSGKKSDKDLGRFLDISLGSLYETLAALHTLHLVGFYQTKKSLLSKKKWQMLDDKSAVLRKLSTKTRRILVVGCGS